jgi:hypothetical protein
VALAFVGEEEGVMVFDDVGAFVVDDVGLNEGRALGFPLGTTLEQDSVTVLPLVHVTEV